jgi:hypothetical protein
MAIWQVKFVPKIIREIKAIVNDVRLVDRKDGVACLVRLGRDHPVRVDRDQPWSRRDELRGAAQRLVEGSWPRPPLGKPEVVVLDVEEDAIER